MVFIDYRKSISFYNLREFSGIFPVFVALYEHAIWWGREAGGFGMMGDGEGCGRLVYPSTTRDPEKTQLHFFGNGKGLVSKSRGDLDSNERHWGEFQKKYLGNFFNWIYLYGERNFFFLFFGVLD